MKALKAFQGKIQGANPASQHSDPSKEGAKSIENKRVSAGVRKAHHQVTKHDRSSDVAQQPERPVSVFKH